MKEPIERHEARLAIWARHIERDKADLNDRIAASQRLEARFDFYRRQIEEAKKRGMDGFDEDRLLVKRRGNK